MILKLIASEIKKDQKLGRAKKTTFLPRKRHKIWQAFACRLYPSHGPLRFIASHSRFVLAFTMRKTKRLRRRLYFHDFSVENSLILYAKQNKSGSESSASDLKQGTGSGFEGLYGTALRRLPLSAPPPGPLILPEEDEREWLRAHFPERWLERDSTIFFNFW